MGSFSQLHFFPFQGFDVEAPSTSGPFPKCDELDSTRDSKTKKEKVTDEKE